MAANMSSLVLNANEGEITFEAGGEYGIWKATAETTDGRYDQAVTITLPQVGAHEHTISKMNCSTFWKGFTG